MKHHNNFKQIGASNYQLPTYTLDSTEGKRLQMTMFPIDITFVKGGENPQRGIITEDLLEMLIHHLKEINVGHLENYHTSMSIANLEKALIWIKARKIDRVQRGVTGTQKQ